MARPKGWDAPSTVTIDLEGQEFSGTYTVSSQIVTVHSIYGSKATQAGGSGAEIIARVLLREIARAARARGEA